MIGLSLWYIKDIFLKGGHFIKDRNIPSWNTGLFDVLTQYHNIDFIQLTDDGFEEFIQYQLRNPTLREIDLKVDLHIVYLSWIWY